LLTARSWYQGQNAEAAEAALKEAVTNVITGEATVQEALNLAAQKVTATL